MIAPLLPLLLGARPRIVLKPSRDPVDAIFHTEPQEKAEAVWVDGRDTGVRVPPVQAGFFEIEERSNARGDLGGEFTDVYGGAMDGAHHFLFAKLRGARFALLPPPDEGKNSAFAGLNARGRLLAVDDPEMTNLNDVSHAFLWTGSQWIGLGPAGEARFARDGSVVGTYKVDLKGHPVGTIDRPGANRCASDGRAASAPSRSPTRRSPRARAFGAGRSRRSA